MNTVRYLLAVTVAKINRLCGTLAPSTSASVQTADSEAELSQYKTMSVPVVTVESLAFLKQNAVSKNSPTLKRYNSILEYFEYF